MCNQFGIYSFRRIMTLIPHLTRGARIGQFSDPHFNLTNPMATPCDIEFSSSFGKESRLRSLSNVMLPYLEGRVGIN